MNAKKCTSIVMGCLAATMLLIGSVSGESKKPSLQVEIMVYSGRRNPQMELDSPEDIQTIKQMYRSRQNAVRNGLSAARAHRMGYTGILVRNAAGIEGLPSEFTIYDRQIAAKTVQPATLFSASRAATTESYASDTKSLETQLLDMAHARGAVSSRLRETILRESGK